MDLSQIKKTISSLSDRLDKTSEQLQTFKSDAEKYKEQAEKYKQELETVKGAGFINPEQFLQAGIRHNSIEQQALKSYLVDHPQKLLHINTNAPEFAYVSQEVKKYVMQLKSDVTVARMISAKFYENISDSFDNEVSLPRAKSIFDHRFGRGVLSPRIKSFGTDSTNEGKEWVGTETASNYIEEFEIEAQLIKQFTTVRMPTKKYEWPVAGHAMARRGKEHSSRSDAQSSNSFRTSNIEFVARKFEDFYFLPEELIEDTAPDIFQYANMELTRSHIRAQESAIINGVEATNKHIDSDVTADTDARRNFDGLRYIALQNSANNSVVDFKGESIKENYLRQMMTNMGGLGLIPSELLWIVGPTGNGQMSAIPNVITVDNFGPNATILTGFAKQILGAGIYPSQWVREDLNATGKHDGTTTNLMSVLLVHKKRFFNGLRRPIRKKLVSAPSSVDAQEIASYSRVDFKGLAQSDKEIAVTIGINISKTFGA